MTWWWVAMGVLFALEVVALVLVVKWGREATEGWEAAADGWRIAAERWEVAQQSWERAEKAWAEVAEIAERRRGSGS